MDKTEAYLKISEEIKGNTELRKFFYLLEQTHTETYLHSLHVGLLTTIMCDALNYDKDHTKLLIDSALVHDAGKIKIPKSILDKESSLDEEERLYVK